ncbi:hypothetical protein GPJ56_002728 [Histomonas meleagridis]|uniref:uncharacterized protein n=1 Tax=Histomonas meleagridis TaxID=135588 RepID=UPI00355A095E|nr:hypothetical protein GPJ56_002728 [Histomonas meleagridis]KAH0800035.1 hypothetical protein GO595_007147 [Histomonas meleagridis]
MSSILINLHLTYDKTTTAVSVDPLSTISDLDCYQNDLLFVHNGNVLSPAFTFQFYQITSGDNIYVAKKATNPTKTIPIARFTKYLTPSELLDPIKRKKHFKAVLGYVPDPEYMQFIVDNLTDPSLAIEASKIKDRFFQRVEGSYNLNQKVMSRFSSVQQKLIIPETKIDLKIGKAQSAPSTNQLPQLWSL